MRAIQETASLPSEVSPRERVSRLQRLTIVWLTVLTAFLILFGWRQGTSPPGRPEIASAQGALGTSARPVVPSDVSVADGPWGRLEIVPITICPPAEYLDERMESYVAPVVWYFPGIDSSELSDLLLRLGLPSSLIDQLMSDTEWDESIQGCAVFPDREVVLGLTAEVRTRLYLMLHEFAENPVAERLRLHEVAVGRRPDPGNSPRVPVSLDFAAALRCSQPAADERLIGLQMELESPGMVADTIGLVSAATSSGKMRGASGQFESVRMPLENVVRTVLEVAEQAIFACVGKGVQTVPANLGHRVRVHVGAHRGGE